MTNRIDDQLAYAESDSMIDRAVENQERFIIERRGQPAVVMLSVRDFIETLSEILQECDEILRRPKFAFAPDEIEGLIAAVRLAGSAVDAPTNQAVSPDPTHRLFLKAGPMFFAIN